MKARDMGRFLSSFLEGFVEGDGGDLAGVAPAPVAPMVIPVDAVREAVREFLQPLIEADAPSAPDLDMYTHNIEREDADPMAEAIRNRVQQTRDYAQRDNAAEGPSWVYAPDDPGAGAPWMSPIADQTAPR